MPSKDSATRITLSAEESPNLNHNFTNNIQNTVGGYHSIQGMVPRDVDELVNEIKLNLRLKGATNCTSMECNVEREFVGKTPATMSTCRLESNNIDCTSSNNNNNNDGSGGGGGSVLVRTKLRSSNRLAPYYIPSRSGTDSGCHSCGSPRCLRTCLRQPKSNSSDPYQLLQELLKEGGLIKEAVRRISRTESPPLKYYDYENDDYETSANNTLIGLEA